MLNLTDFSHKSLIADKKKSFKNIENGLMPSKIVSIQIPLSFKKSVEFEKNLAVFKNRVVFRIEIKLHTGTYILHYSRIFIWEKFAFFLLIFT